MSTKKFLPRILLLILLVFPLQTFAFTPFVDPIVPVECKCNDQPVEGGTTVVNSAPDYGCVLQVIQNVVNTAISVAMLLVVTYIIIAGFQFVLSGSGGEALSSAKTRITNVVLGTIVLLVAWLLVDYVMKTIYEPTANANGIKLGPWNSILAGQPDKSDRCIIATTATGLHSAAMGVDYAVAEQDGENVGTSGTPSGGGGGDRCSTIPDSQLVSIGGGFKLIPSAASQYTKMKAAAAKNGINLAVSSAYRSPDRQTTAWNNNGCRLVSGKTVCNKLTAAVPCSLGGSGSNHSLGVAIDVVRSPGAIEWVNRNGAQYGFINRLPGDPVHFSSSGR